MKSLKEKVYKNLSFIINYIIIKEYINITINP